MRQLLTRFQWLSPVLGVAVLLGARLATGWLAGAGASVAEGSTSLWGAWAAPPAGFWPASVLTAITVVALGHFAAATLQVYRVGQAGSFPTWLAAALAAASVGVQLSWTLSGAALLTAWAAHRLFAGYRHQGAALPVYDAGVLTGLAWLLAGPFASAVAWAALTLGQLRKLRFVDLAQLLLGVLTPVLLVGSYAYVWGDWAGFTTQALRPGLALPSWPPALPDQVALTALALATLAALSAWGSLTGRRPILEQRALRMAYTLLGTGWLAALATGLEPATTLALLAYPLSLLLGTRLSELRRGRGERLTWLALLLALVAGIGAPMLA